MSRIMPMSSKIAKKGAKIGWDFELNPFAENFSAKIYFYANFESEIKVLFSELNNITY